MLVGGGSSPPARRPRPAPHQIQWYEPVIVAAGVSVFFLVDNPVRSYMLDNQTTGKDNAADIFKVMGQPEVWALVPAVMIGTGLAFKKPGLTHTGLRAVTSAALAGGVTAVLKEAFGRVRPRRRGLRAARFRAVLRRTSRCPPATPPRPSASPRALPDDVHPLWAKIGLYALATGTAWSRVYDNKHWTSDVVAGAVVGIASAKIVRGSWQVWGIRMPAVFTDGHQVTVSWHGTF